MGLWLDPRGGAGDGCAVGSGEVEVTDVELVMVERVDATATTEHR